MRESILEKLRPKLQPGGRQLVGNGGCRRHLKSGQQAFGLDEEKNWAVERYDALWALAMHGPPTAVEAAVKHQELWRAEQCRFGPGWDPMAPHLQHAEYFHSRPTS